MTTADITARHKLLDGKVQLYLRAGSPHWQCSCTIAGRQKRTTTKEESLARAKDVARDWYLGLLGKYRQGEIKEGTSFKHAAERFIDEFEIVTQGQRSPIYVAHHRRRLDNYLVPFFGTKVLGEITPGLVQDYRIHRMKMGNPIRRGASLKKIAADEAAAKAEAAASSAPVKAVEPERKIAPPSRSTLHQEIVCLRQVLKFANRHGWIEYVPNLSPPYRASSKISHRAWFSPEEYKRLYEATRDRIANPRHNRGRWVKEAEDLRDYVLIMVNTGLRPDEALRLEYRDVSIVTDEATGQTILEIAVRGKRGVGFCKSMPGAVHPFQRLKKRNKGEPTDHLFPKFQRQLFNAILDELGLKKDREGQSRTAYSLRHTYICLRLMEGADIYQIAKNCRTSVEMIEKYYASHIANTLDAAAINVMRTPPRKPKGGKPPNQPSA